MQQLAMSSTLRQANLHPGRILQWQADPVLCTSSHDDQHLHSYMKCMYEHSKLQPCQSPLFDPDWRPSSSDQKTTEALAQLPDAGVCLYLPCTGVVGCYGSDTRPLIRSISFYKESLSINRAKHCLNSFDLGTRQPKGPSCKILLLENV